MCNILVNTDVTEVGKIITNNEYFEVCVQWEAVDSF